MNCGGPGAVLRTCKRQPKATFRSLCYCCNRLSDHSTEVTEGIYRDQNVIQQNCRGFGVAAVIRTLNSSHVKALGDQPQAECRWL